MSVSENENVVSRVLVWLNGIVEAFDDRNCKLPIKTADHSTPRAIQASPKSGGTTAIYALQLIFRLQYSPEVDNNHAVFISASSSFLAKSCFFNRASTSAGR